MTSSTSTATTPKVTPKQPSPEVPRPSPASSVLRRLSVLVGLPDARIPPPVSPSLWVRPLKSAIEVQKYRLARLDETPISSGATTIGDTITRAKSPSPTIRATTSTLPSHSGQHRTVSEADVVMENANVTEHANSSSSVSHTVLAQYIKADVLPNTTSELARKAYFLTLDKQRRFRLLEVYLKYLSNASPAPGANNDFLRNYYAKKVQQHESQNNSSVTHTQQINDIRANETDLDNNQNSTQSLSQTEFHPQSQTKEISDLNTEIHVTFEPRQAIPSRSLAAIPRISPSPVVKRQQLHSPHPGPVVVPQLKDLDINKPSSGIPKPPTVRYLPRDFMHCPVDHLIALVSRMLQSLIRLNDKSLPPQTVTVVDSSGVSSTTTNRQVLTRYHSRVPPQIMTSTYLTRLTKFNNFTAATLLTTIYYIDLLSHNYQPFFTLNSYTVHRFLLVATMLSQKLMEDFFYTNDHYARVGGVAVTELNCLELDFLTRVDWKCIPAKEGKGGIKYCKDVLDLYYKQLIELMGQNVSSNDEEQIVFKLSENESGDDDDDEDEDDDGEDDDDDDDEYDEYDSDEDMSCDSPVAYYQYDSKGYSFDGSSSPHLKRRYDNSAPDSR